MKEKLGEFTILDPLPCSENQLDEDTSKLTAHEKSREIHSTTHPHKILTTFQQEKLLSAFIMIKLHLKSFSLFAEEVHFTLSYLCCLLLFIIMTLINNKWGERETGGGNELLFFGTFCWQTLFNVNIFSFRL